MPSGISEIKRKCAFHFSKQKQYSYCEIIADSPLQHGTLCIALFWIFQYEIFPLHLQSLCFFSVDKTHKDAHQCEKAVTVKSFYNKRQIKHLIFAF